MKTHLDPLTALQVKVLRQRARKRISCNRESIYKMKGTQTQIQASIGSTSDAFYLRFMRTWKREFTKSIRNLQDEIADDRFYLSD